MTQYNGTGYRISFLRQMNSGLLSSGPKEKLVIYFRYNDVAYSLMDLPALISEPPCRVFFDEYCLPTFAGVLAGIVKQELYREVNAASQERKASASVSVTTRFEERLMISKAESSSRPLSCAVPFQHTSARQITMHLKIQLCLRISISVQR